MTATTGRDRDIAAAYASGLSQPACAARFGISLYAVRGALARTGTPPRKAARPLKERPWEAEAAARSLAGERKSDLAREYGVHKSVMLRVLGRQGVTVTRDRPGPRPRGAA